VQVELGARPMPTRHSFATADKAGHAPKVPPRTAQNGGRIIGGMPGSFGVRLLEGRPTGGPRARRRAPGERP
jgi:hypothetical protein